MADCGAKDDVDSNEYTQALGEALVWAQAIEHFIVHLLVTRHGESEKKLEHSTLGMVVKKLKPHIDDALYCELRCFVKERNHLAHSCTYVVDTLLRALGECPINDIDEEINRFRQAKCWAGDLFGRLV